MITNRIYESMYQGFIKKDEIYYNVPLFCKMRGNILGHLYKYDYAELYHQVDNSDINEFTVDALNEAAIGLIEAFDIADDARLLDLAQYILKKILTVCPMEIYATINIYQIKKRLNLLDKTDRQELQNIFDSTEDVSIKCGVCALLDKKEEAGKFFAMIPEQDKEKFQGYPICKYL